MTYSRNTHESGGRSCHAHLTGTAVPLANFGYGVEGEKNRYNFVTKDFLVCFWQAR